MREPVEGRPRMARVAVVSALLLAVGAGVTVARGSRVAAAGTESVGRSPTAPGRQHEDRTRNAPEAAPAPPVPDHPDRLVFPPRAIEIPRAEPVTHRLSNGTAVIVVEDASLPLVEIAVALRAGSYLDPDDAPGLAELTGALVRRGGTTERDADLFDEAVDALGAEIDTRAGGTRAGATLDCLAETLEASLDLFFEMLRQPAFQRDRLDGVRSNLYASFAARNDDPLDLMEREWGWLLMGERHYLGRQLRRVDLESLDRDRLVAFHARWWRPENAVIAVSGAVATEAVLALLEAHVARWTAALPELEVATPPWPPAARAEPAAPGLYLAGEPGPQAKVSLGHPVAGVPDWLDADALALEVANEILGGTSGFVSRLAGRLRGEGWVYRVLSEAEVGRHGPGRFRIFLDAAPANVVDALAACLEEIERLRSSPVPARTLAIVKEQLLSVLALRFDTAEEIAGYFAEDLLLGRPHDYWYSYPERLAALTPRDLRRAARRFLDPDALRILVVGGGDASLEGSTRAPLRRWLASPVRRPARNPLSLAPETPAVRTVSPDGAAL